MLRTMPRATKPSKRSTSKPQTKARTKPQARRAKARSAVAARGAAPSAKPARKGSAKSATSVKRPARAPNKPAPRADFGAPVDGFFLKQPPALRPIVDALRTMIEAAAPEATSAIKWGMPVYSVGGAIMCAITAHRAHVNLVLSGPPSAFDDPEGRLTGSGKTGRHLKLETLGELPRASVKAWLAKARAIARGRA